jgi:galactose oxidase
MKPLTLLGFTLLVLGSLVVFACRDTAEVTEPTSAVAASSAATLGRWGQPFTTPAVAVHVHLLRTGKVLLWGDQKDGYLWSASTGFTAVAPKPFRIYCTGHTFLADGRLLVMGGTSPGTRGLRYATIFDPASSTWNATASMAQGRYYPTATTLPNGNVLVVSGHDTAKAVVRIPEIRNATGWRRLTTAPLAIPNPFYPAIFVAPNGKVFLAGFTPTSAYLDVGGTGQWTPVDQREVVGRKLGSAVMYAPGKILYVGGGVDSVFARDTLLPPTASAEVIDLNQASPVWRTVPGMAFPRRQHNATILADGSVLVTGGTSGAGFNNQAAAVRAAELWNPQTERWTTLASESRTRTYHSSAILLPNGRVLSTGGGEGGGITFGNSEFSAQLFTPPYLFDSDGTLAARPSITSAPSRLVYGQSFTIQTPDAGSISRGTLIRLSSVTHGFNQSQLLFPLAVTATSSTSLGSLAPGRGALAPPGPYMLFLINSSGVPSVAKMVTVGP